MTLARDPLGPARESTSALPGEIDGETEQALPGNRKGTADT